MKQFNYKKLNAQQLKKKGFLLFDMHIHTSLEEGTADITYILKKAKRLGIGVGITDHEGIDSAVKAFNNKLGVLVIPGIEVKTSEGIHLLFYFEDIGELKKFYDLHVKNKMKKHSLKEIVKFSKKFSCLFVVPHPFGYYPWHRRLLDEEAMAVLGKNIDAVEVINGHNVFCQAKKAYDWSRKIGAGIIGGSDAHMGVEVGRVLTGAKAKSVKGFLKAVKDKKTFVAGKPFFFIIRLILIPVNHIGRLFVK